MKTYANGFDTFETSPHKEPRFVVQLSWDAADTDYTYLTSSSACNVPTSSPAVDRIDDAVIGISGQTMTINPDIATSTIGAVKISLLDVTDSVSSPALPIQLTTRINTKLTAGDGLRGKVVRIYVGYEDMPFTSYDLRLTYIIDSISYRDGIYTVNTSDIQRSARKKIFTPDETTLDSSIDEYALIIPVTDIDATLFPAVSHGAEWAVFPSESVSYIKIDKEVICHSGGISFDTTNGYHITALQRGALNTVPAVHDVSNASDDNRKPKITEHIYIEGAAPKVLYALLTGVLLNGNSPEDTLPDHWHLGIDTGFVRLSDFQNLGTDVWDTSDDSGRFVRIENPGKQDGKRYIEKEILLWLGAFMPIYSSGEIGIRKLAGILSDSSYQVALDKYNIKSYSDLSHDMRSVINDIRVEWNYVDSKEKFTKTSLFIDADSIAKHGTADSKLFEFRTVQTGLHTDEDLYMYFDVIRDRYSGPPMKMSLNLMPSMAKIEVGDTVRVTLEQVRDFNTGTTLDRTFEVQSVTTNWVTGALSVKLFGSSQGAGTLTRTTASSVLQDSYYTQAGTELSTVLTIVAGHITVSGTLTGSASSIDNTASIYYYDGDLTLNAGVTLTVAENVQLRIKGAFEVIGTIDGIGNGATGGAATTTFENLTTTAYTATLYEVPSAIKYNQGEQGYYGSPLPPGALITGTNASYSSTPPASSIISMYEPGTPTLNTVDVMDFRRLVNDQQSNTLVGYPLDLRGNAGISGAPYIHTGRNGGNDGYRYIKAAGGAGGDGGAGLLIICRGMSFSGSGNIDLSGGPSVIGSSYTQGTGEKFYGSAGAPGAPGVLYILIDGQSTNPDITATTFTAQYGDMPVPVGATSIDIADIGTFNYWFQNYNPKYTFNGDGTSNVWPYGDAVGKRTLLTDVTENIDVYGAAHRIQYIPPDETPLYQGDDDTNFDTLPVWGYVEVNAFQLPTPATNDFLGKAVEGTSDGTRAVVGTKNIPSVAGEVNIFRNVVKAALEQNIVDPLAAAADYFGKVLKISDTGDRIIISAHGSTVSGYATAGLVYVYTRSGVTWSIEQTLQHSDPSIETGFGFDFDVNDDFDQLLVSIDNYNSTGPACEYFTRSGTTWTSQGIMSSGVMQNAFVEMDGRGYYAIFSDSTTQAVIYKRTGTSWAIDAYLAPDSTTGWSSYPFAMNYDASAIAFGATGSDGAVAIYYRESANYQLIQVLKNPYTILGGSPSVGFFGYKITMSNDGLRLVVYDNYDKAIYIFKRTQTRQPFREYQRIVSIDVGTYEPVVSMSRYGNLLFIGNPKQYVTNNQEGIVHVWQTISN